MEGTMEFKNLGVDCWTSAPCSCIDSKDAVTKSTMWLSGIPLKHLFDFFKRNFGTSTRCQGYIILCTHEQCGAGTKTPGELAYGVIIM